jgi:hypothetical protein
LKHGRKPPGCHRLALVDLAPWSLFFCGKKVEKLFRRKPARTSLGKRLADIGEQIDL